MTEKMGVEPILRNAVRPFCVETSAKAQTADIRSAAVHAAANDSGSNRSTQYVLQIFLPVFQPICMEKSTAATSLVSAPTEM